MDRLDERTRMGHAAPAIEAFLAQTPDNPFPLVDHPLYGSAQGIEDLPCLLPQVLAEFTEQRDFDGDVTQLEICPTCFFQTSGTTSRSKRIPYSAHDLENQKLHEALAFSKLGMRPSDCVMTLASPLPSISGWATINGTQALGASVANTSQLDWEDVFLRGMQQKVSFMFATPIVAIEIGKQIEQTHGPLAEVFPALRTAIIFGDVLPDSMRETIRTQWGLDRVLSLYGTVEADVVATECLAQAGRMHLMSERLVFELIPESGLARERAEPGYQAAPVPIDQVEDGTVGEIIISDLNREVLPLIRYRIGDVVEVRKDTCGCPHTLPTVTVLGRAKNTVMVGHVPVYEMNWNRAIAHAAGGKVVDWRLVERGHSRGSYELDLIYEGERTAEALKLDIVRELTMLRPALKDVKGLDAAIHCRRVDRLEQVPVKGDAKARRIVLSV